jgi:hypothetical protein
MERFAGRAYVSFLGAMLPQGANIQQYEAAIKKSTGQRAGEVAQ